MIPIRGNDFVGGIAGGAWSEENEAIIIECSFCNNVISCNGVHNGGILGGTYFDYTGEKVDGLNIIKECYSVSQVISDVPNQIVDSYANIDTCFYISGRMNYSGYGTPKDEYLFKANDSNINSILYILNSKTAGIWTIKSDTNQGYVFYLWAI